MTDYLLVTTVAADRETAARLAGSAVRTRLAACAQVHGPVSSFFWHLGELGEGEEWQVTFKTEEWQVTFKTEEWQVTFKTTVARYEKLEEHLIAIHNWDNPEVTAIPLVAGSAPYLRWLDTATAHSTDTPDTA